MILHKPGIEFQSLFQIPKFLFTTLQNWYSTFHVLKLKPLVLTPFILSLLKTLEVFKVWHIVCVCLLTLIMLRTAGYSVSVRNLAPSVSKSSRKNLALLMHPYLIEVKNIARSMLSGAYQCGMCISSYSKLNPNQHSLSFQSTQCTYSSH